MAEPAGFLNSEHQTVLFNHYIIPPFMIEYTLEIEVVSKVFAWFKWTTADFIPLGSFTFSSFLPKERSD